MDEHQDRFDVFVSYADPDREWVETWLIPHFISADLRVCTTHLFTPGVPRIVNTEQAIAQSRYIVAVLSPAARANGWNELHALLVQTTDPAAREGRLIPLLYQPCELPTSINALTPVDCTRSEIRAREIQRVIDTVRDKPRFFSGRSGRRDVRTATDDRNRRTMLQKVRNFWVKGVLEHSLYTTALIELDLEYAPDAVFYSWNMVLQRPTHPTHRLPPGTKISDVFDEQGGELLMLGAPGSGKTTMLLDLARTLIDRAEHDYTSPMPVVFNLSSWSQQRLPLTTWLVEELSSRYQVPKKIGVMWVEHNQILPLLDGLDEVEAGSREPCVEAINRFRQEHGMLGMVVCSRSLDYADLHVRLGLQGAIVLQPLTLEQVNTYMRLAGEQLTSIHSLLQEDSTLQELITTPLMLSIISLAYQGKTIAELETKGSRLAWRKDIFDTYVEQMFRRRGEDRRYPRAKVREWLSWLADTMVRRNQTIFSLEGLQPDLLPTRKQQRVYIVRSATIALLAYMWWFAPLLPFLIAVAWTFWHLSLIGFKGRVDQIKIVEVLTWSWTKVLLPVAAGFFVVQIPVWGVIALILADPDWTLASVTLVALGGLISGLLLGVVGALFSGIVANELTSRTSPNQGIRRSAKNGLGVGFIGGLLVSSTVFLVFFGLSAMSGGFNWSSYVVSDNFDDGIVWSAVLGLLVGPALALRYGCMTWIQHFVLRFMLYRNGSMPWRSIRFLNYAVDRLFLRRVGGDYMFIHRLLLEYFAEQQASSAQVAVNQLAHDISNDPLLSAATPAHPFHNPTDIPALDDQRLSYGKPSLQDPTFKPHFVHSLRHIRTSLVMRIRSVIRSIQYRLPGKLPAFLQGLLQLRIRPWLTPVVGSLVILDVVITLLVVIGINRPDGTLLETMRLAVDVGSISFTPNNHALIIVPKWTPKNIEFWQRNNDTPVWTSVPIGEFAFTPDKQIMAVAVDKPPTANGTNSSYRLLIQLRRVSDGKILHSLEGYGGEITNLVFSPDGQILASEADNETVMLWHVRDGTPLAILDQFFPTTSVLKFSPDGQILASLYDDWTIQLTRLSDGEPIRYLSGHRKSISDFAFSPDSQTLTTITSGMDQPVRIWQVHTGRLLNTFSLPKSTEDITLAPDGLTVAVELGDLTTQLWQLGKNNRLTVVAHHRSGNLRTTFSPNGQTIVFLDDSNTLEIWRVRDGVLLQRMPESYYGSVLAFTLDGQTLAVGEGGNIQLWRLSDGSHIHSMRLWSPADQLEFSPDGQILASVKDKFVQLWRVELSAEDKQ